MSKQKALCIAGPTASGKSALGMDLAVWLHGEIVCMDSMQIYRGMNIGTAKPTAEEQAKVPHHLVDIKEPSETYTVAQYAQDAQRVMAEIAQRGHLPILVGGTGFYLKALTHGLHLGGVRSDPKIRQRLKAIAQDDEGKQKLHSMLTQVDPEKAKRLHPNDITRVSRALEVFELTGAPMSKQAHPAFESPFEFCILGTTRKREALYRRINMRVDEMVAQGLLAEVAALLAAGISPKAQAMQGIGYKELVPVLTDGYPPEHAISDVKRNSRHYAKRQLTWFKRDAQLHWLDMDEDNAYEKAHTLAQSFREGKPLNEHAG